MQQKATNIEPLKKIDSKYPKFDTMLTFTWCKINTCPRNILSSVVEKFHKPNYVADAGDTIFAEDDQSDNDKHMIRHRAKIKLFGGIYRLLQGV